MSRVKVGLVLGSGSARGLAHIGVLKVLEREGIPVDLIAGTSIGALIGGISAAGMSAAEMEEIARSVNLKKLISLVDIARPSTALVNGNKVEEFIRTLVDGKDFSELNVPFACVAVDVLAGREVVLQDGDVVTAIRASISTPVIFAPVRKKESLLVDGGVLNPIPVDVAKNMGADVIIAVSVAGIPKARTPVYSSASGEVETGNIKRRGFPEIVYSRAVSSVKRRLHLPTVYQLAATSVDLMQRELSESKLKAADIIIVPQIDDTTYFGFYEAKRSIALGEKAAERAVDDIKAIIQRKATA